MILWTDILIVLEQLINFMASTIWLPLSLDDDIKQELVDKVQQGITAKIREGEPTAWVDSLVYR